MLTDTLPRGQAFYFQQAGSSSIRRKFKSEWFPPHIVQRLSESSRTHGLGVVLPAVGVKRDLGGYVIGSISLNNPNNALETRLKAPK